MSAPHQHATGDPEPRDVYRWCIARGLALLLTGEEEPMYAWDVRTPDLGAGGVTDVRERAFQEVDAALRKGEPGAVGVVREVVLGTGTITYRDVRVVGEARLDGDSGSVVWAHE
ncbi:hypothetical protein [Actinomadura sp. NEAU-AAG7]|uniref:hypothetical protein n=1 Tax=Actinomadura sp. NEAU-AAG7 TaxID=2839640 RepID=UPI001BE4897D|nr:hypothetical protein [Actinomadura sp. NEAU-AAG7]MBT2207816.1 hypothetical protein [Actinomadura sp. NEAU-AAG7]